MILFLIIVGVLLLVTVGWLIAVYNRFVTLITRIKEAWADIDVQLKRRYDLIPNLVNVVKGYAAHEREAFEHVTEARAKAIGAGNVEEKSAAEAELGGTLKSLFAVAEAYPDLKANQNFLELQRELSDTENKIQAARRFYNSNVRDLNITVDSFPSNLIANWFGFEKVGFFELSENSQEKEIPKVSF
jgi:LemA protein